MSLLAGCAARHISAFSRLSMQNGVSRIMQSGRQLSRSPRSYTEGEKTMKELHTPTEFDRKILVWTKFYGSAEDIPGQVSPATMRKARDYMRIRVNIGMAAATVVGCIIMIWSGRRSRDSGDSLASRGRQWEAEMKARGQQEKEAAQQKT